MGMEQGGKRLEKLEALETELFDLYWKQKDMAGVTRVGQEGVALALAEAERAEAGDVLTFNLHASKFAYNVASFCWPGWDEPGIVLGEPEISAGIAAATLNQHLVQDLEVPPIKHARAAWIVGAHALTAADYQRAQEQFAQSAAHAEAAGNAAETLLGQTFAALAAHLFAPELETRLEAFTALMTQLAQAKDGHEFVRQVETAHRVCT